MNEEIIFPNIVSFFGYRIPSSVLEKCLLFPAMLSVHPIHPYRVNFRLIFHIIKPSTLLFFPSPVAILVELLTERQKFK